MNIILPKWVKGSLYGVVFALVTILPRFLPYVVLMIFPNLIGFLIKINPGYWVNIFLHKGVWWQYFFYIFPYLEIFLFIIIPAILGSLIVDLFQRFKNKTKINFYRLIFYFIALYLVLTPIVIPIIKYPLKLLLPESPLSWNRVINFGCNFTIKYPGSMKISNVYPNPAVCGVELGDGEGKITVQNVSNDPYAYVDTRFVNYPEKEETVKISGTVARKILKSGNNIIVVLNDKSFNCFFNGLDEKREVTFLNRCVKIASTYYSLK